MLGDLSGLLILRKTMGLYGGKQLPVSGLVIFGCTLLRNGGRWSEARYHSFIKSALRSASNRYPPKYECRKASWVSRGRYKCAGYNKKSHIVDASICHNNRRVSNITADHVVPVVAPDVGFTSWDTLIERLFCEASGFQMLCRECHAAKTADERLIRKKKKVD